MSDIPLSSPQLEEIEVVLGRIEGLAGRLSVDPGGHVHRSAAELRDAFTGRNAIEPAVARVRDSIRMLRGSSHDGARREFQRRAQRLDYLEHVIAHDLLPQLRRVGFDV